MATHRLFPWAHILNVRAFIITFKRRFGSKGNPTDAWRCEAGAHCVQSNHTSALRASLQMLSPVVPDPSGPTEAWWFPKTLLPTLQPHGRALSSSILLDIWGGEGGRAALKSCSAMSQALGTQPCSPADRADHTKAGHVHSQQNPCCCFFLTDTFSVLPACPLLCLVKNKIKKCTQICMQAGSSHTRFQQWQF